ncbi:choline ABC transporter substrate-binding protein [Acetobacter sp.]|jgi:glycine betaine/proline transport system substrate-binding protein|uniref:choline ABC transporter substrate-binding protein n=1 Tax=Acetobacter sp. TaxID=440 RepID=UPI0025C22800|nr:choline ABC transporter substrate-binding protein [Acetobacter sp.]MCH4090973.1 choline ABC transporter substrate-binding protein [Acetobacter sp.]MCI1300814.1 choline ABC transporter substrate-binding protein [Acetobacter sp.]MCI1317081.1 choline ABC transporter substrate-binding protein [Acetobacter sp.]
MKKKILASMVFLGMGLRVLPAHAAEAEACQMVRIGDVGWSDAAVTNGVAANLLAGLGYKTKTTMVTLAVAYLSLENHQLDVFLSDWEPSGASYIDPYLKRGKVERIVKNLAGARYTLAVPDYVAKQGLTQFKDIAGWASKLNSTIYGIESGNDGNKIVLDIIKANDFGLGKFHLNESSEQGMLSQVSRAVSAQKPIVFLAWEPHPMNMNFHLTYLSGGEKQFGASAEVNTIVTSGYVEKCPNVGHLLKQLTFTIPAENEMMKEVAETHAKPEKVAKDWLKAHPEAVEKWLDGVSTADGKPGLSAVKTYLDQ